ncbi:alpha/beta fold hydrolase [Streptomyces beihaiensis]|uniref:Lipase family protein n=1 Tax=Streptomyces beihaiensis TaxID=2984495 RepID=A0ABT3TRN6_9ACTN|nr:alpha/beta fold hydrolase [Streptomyces beihaiensis]MCX3059705.1 lipase family protein [Streptomyces beihaiensis]
MRNSARRTALAAATALPLALAAPLTAHADSGSGPVSSASASSGRPGDLVSVARSSFHPLPGQPTGTKAWKILYRSTTATGAPDTVSGTVIVPQDGRTGPRPLVTYAVGTVGLADRCAPSAGFPNGTTMEANLIQQLTARGWAVAVTDYEGLGTPGEHTYTVGRSEGQAMLDAARAAIRLPEAGLGADTPVGVMGYSQGGQAAGWAAELHKSYAPELNLKGTAAGGVPGDLMKVAAADDGSYGSGLVLMAAIGQNAAFPELDLDSYLNARGRDLVGRLKNSCVIDGSVLGSFTRIKDVTVKNPLAQADWQARLNQSKVGTLAPDAPVYLYHALGDELIPYRVGRQVRADWCARGANVEWHTVPVGEHISGVITQSPFAAQWLADRFSGKPAHSTC